MDVMFSDALNWILISFLIFAGIFYKLAWPKVTASLDGRISQIRTDIETAERLKLQAENLLQEYQEKQAQAAAEAQRIIQDAKEQADLFAKAEEDKLNNMITHKEAQLAERLSRLKEQAIADIRAEVATLATRATHEVILGNADPQKGHALIQASLDKVH